ncbi:MAG: recombinase family protein, partial [Negativicoccus succinicivorans]|nr:recombinase family protein [Negativicoccus succinicivorans]
MKTFGYVRVSTREQNPKRQIDELKKYISDER